MRDRREAIVSVGWEGRRTYYVYIMTNRTRRLYISVAMLSLELHEYGFGISLIFFGFTCLLVGYLIFKSVYFPKTLGVLLLIGSLCYVTNSFALFLAPAFEAMIFPGILLPWFIAELSLCLWLIVIGVNVPKWEEKANRPGIRAA